MNQRWLFIVALAACSEGSSRDAAFDRDLAQAGSLRPVEKVDTARARAEADMFGTIDQLTEKALRGDYQAQRNLAYRYSTGDAVVAKNPVEGCAWREVVMLSGHPQAIAGDASNRDVECGRLASSERELATQKAKRYFEAVR